MTEATRRIDHRGNPSFVSMLVSMLEAEGVEVQWERPREERGGADDVALSLLASGAYDGIKAAVTRFRERAGARAEVDIEDEDD